MDPKDKTRILVTRRLTEKQVAYANTLGMDPVAGPAYHVEYLSDRRKVVQRLDTYSGGNWIFTSRNGVEALKRLFDSEQLARPLPKTYAVGEKTAGALSRLGLEARFPETQNAAGLARLIADDLSPSPAAGPVKTRFPGSKEPSGDESIQPETPFSADHPVLVHWCGNRRRPELKSGLKRHGMGLVEMEVYRTTLNKINLPEEPVGAILFYSPGAVEAFRKSGGFGRELPPLFAIGSTTGEALSLESGENVHIPDRPSTEALLELAAAIIRVEA